MNIEQFKMDYFKSDDKILVNCRELQELFRENERLKRENCKLQSEVEQKVFQNNLLRDKITRQTLEAPIYRELDLRT